MILTLASLAGCGRYAVRADEKEFLADRIMQPDYDAMETASDQHVLNNREGSQGGFGAAGGGCGCN
jgi:Domain of unknown function (DUF4266)